MIEEEIIVMLLNGAKLVITDKTLSSACNYKREKAVLYIFSKYEEVMKLSLFSRSYANTPAWKMIQKSCCFLLQTIVTPVGKIWEIYDIYTSLNYGLSLRLYPMGLQDGSFKGFPFHASLPSF